MNQIENFLLLATIQAILFSVILCVLVLLSKKLFRPVNGLILSGLVVLILLWFAALAPLPSWTMSMLLRPINTKQTSFDASQVASKLVTSPVAAGPTTEDVIVGPEVAEVAVPKVVGGIRDQLQQFIQQIESVSVAPPKEESNYFSWRFWFALVAGIGIAIGAIRLTFALASIRRLRKSGTIISDPRLTEVLDVVCAKLGYSRAISVLMTNKTSAAFTVGWRKPTIFIPEEWKLWSPSQLEATIAHEVAHISSGDFFQRLISQTSAALHFYNPLVHLLCGQLILEQELLADDRAAEIVGGRQKYLELLAMMALKTEYPKARLSPMFLPTRKTFFRRIEMLRRTKKSKPQASRASGAFGLVLVIAIGICTAGLRPPVSQTYAGEPATAIAETANGSTTTMIAPAIAPVIASVIQEDADLTYVDANCGLIVVLRPYQLFQNPLLKGLVDGIEESGIEKLDIDFFKGEMGLKSSELDQVTMSFDDVSDWFNSQTVIFKTVDDGWWAGPNPEQAIVDRYDAELVQTYRGAKILKSKKNHAFSGDRNYFWHAVDSKTLIWSSDLSAIKLSIRAKAGPSGAGWHQYWLSHSMDAVSLYVGTSMIELMGAEATNNVGTNPFIGSLAPLWEQTDYVVAGLKLGANSENATISSADVTISCAEVDGAVEVADTFTGIIPLAKNMLRAFKSQLPTATVESDDLIPLFEVPMQVLNSTSVETKDNVVSVSTRLEGEPTQLLKLALPAVLKTRLAATKTSSQNNIRQLAIAMLNYESAFRHYPAPVLLSKEGKKYSWRIAVLPFMNQNELYEAYRFDEEWNSEHNAAITAQVPPIFRHPSSTSKTNASYFPVIGNETVFPNDGKGMELRRITDGTSNTILLVEANRDIHWAEPRDINFGELGLKDNLGFGDEFAAALADGSVRSLSKSISDSIFKALLTRAGGEIINRSKLRKGK